MKISFLSLVCFLWITSFMSAQNSGDLLFTNTIHEVHFDFQQTDYWNQMSQNIDANFGGDIPYILADVSIDGVLLDSVGVRFKGFTSYQPGERKQPIKVDFNEFVADQRYDGLRKLNFNNGFGDPAMQRDVICYNILRSMGLKAPRTSWAKLFMNDEYIGFYIIIEQVDKEFLRNNFSNSNGNLFKNKAWSFLEWLGTNKGPYEEIFDLKTNGTEDDWSGFINLMDVINNDSDGDFEENIESFLNVESFLKNLAVDVAANNWDSFMEHGRNWYMYEDIVTKKFHWIPWDYNFALGGNFDFESDECFIFPDFAFLTNGSTEVEFVDVGFGQGGAAYFWDFGDGNTSIEESPIHRYDSLGIYEVTYEVVVNDTCRESITKPVDTSIDVSQCQVVIDSTFEHIPGMALQAILEFLPNCCSVWNDDCEEFHELFYDIIRGGDFGSFDFSIDQSENERVLIHRLLDIPYYRDYYYSQFCSLLNYNMTEERLIPIIESNDALISSEVALDPNFLFSQMRYEEDLGRVDLNKGLPSYLTNRINELRNELSGLYTCPTALNIEYQDIVINEIVAVSDSVSGIADPAGGYPDWIELYNKTAVPQDLSGIMVSDDKDNLAKWAFPSGAILLPDSYVVLWADNDIEEEGYHLSFKLNKGGESIYLSNSDGTSIDSLNYPEQKNNIAWARIPNGTGDFRFYTMTVADNNENGITSTTGLTQAPSFQPYPNPVNATLYLRANQAIFAQEVEVELYSSAGQKVYSSKSIAVLKNGIDVSELGAGIYLLKLKRINGDAEKHRVVIMR